MAVLTLTRARELASPLGITIRRADFGAGEIVVYPKGAGRDAPCAYFTDCPEDALATAINMVKGDVPKQALVAARKACGFETKPRGTARAEQAGVIDLTPTWESMAPAFFAVLEDGTFEGKQMAREEITKAFRALDAYNMQAKLGR